jgi:hypothetical protein
MYLSNGEADITSVWPLTPDWYERGSRGYGSIIALIQSVIKTMYSIDYCYLFLPMYTYLFMFLAIVHYLEK